MSPEAAKSEIPRSKVLVQRQTWSLLLSAGVAFVAAGYFWGTLGRHTSEQTGTLTSDDAQRLRTLEREVNQLRDLDTRPLSANELVANRPIEFSDPSRLLNRDAGGESEPKDAGELVQLEPHERERMTREARIAFWNGLSARVDTEPLDPMWRRETEPVMARLIPEQLGPQVSVTDVECASTLCRVKLTHPQSPRIPVDKLAQFTLNRGTLEAMEIQFDTREDGSTTLYFLRAEPAGLAVQH